MPYHGLAWLKPDSRKVIIRFPEIFLKNIVKNCSQNLLVKASCLEMDLLNAYLESHD